MKVLPPNCFDCTFILPCRLGMEGGGKIESRAGRRLGMDGCDLLGERLAGEPDGRNAVTVLTPDEQNAMLRQTLKVDAAVFMLLDDF